MSEGFTDAELRAIRRRVLNVYDGITALCMLGIAIMIIYVIKVGPLTSPGAQESFGLALSIMFLLGALLFHIVDRTYRTWPLGRRFSPTPPGPVTGWDIARFLRVFTVVVAGAAIAYLIASMLIL
ncbi:MAG: hypothetical protein M1606_03370 [Candidatus Thermoplasmatota archaeon]|nr:hypothetical protein [Candidatus Thermoplasmatota archaeon]MCL5983687.1 hypothetical protein [Candidatus Thermoplasmatota archaeon]